MNGALVALAPLLPLVCWLVNAALIYHLLKHAQARQAPLGLRSFLLRRSHYERTRATALTVALMYGFLKMVLVIDILFALHEANDCFQYASVRVWFSVHAVFGMYLEMAVLMGVISILSAINWWMIFSLLARRRGIRLGTPAAILACTLWSSVLLVLFAIGAGVTSF